MRLRPLTIGHRLLLHDIRSPFVLRQETYRKIDLQLAVLICAQRYPNALKTFARGELPFAVALFTATVWRWSVRKCDTKTEGARFIRYLIAQQDFPPIRKQLDNDGKYRTLGAPQDWLLIRYLMRIREVQTSYEAMNYPVLRAHALWAADGDYDGTRPLMSENEKDEIHEFWEACKREDQKLYGRS